MRDFFSHYAALAGILFFVGRLHVFPSLSEALVAGLLATATVAIALLAFDRVTGVAPTPTTTSPANASPRQPDA